MKEYSEKIIILFLGVVLLLAFQASYREKGASFQKYNLDTVHYLPATVVAVENEELKEDELDPTRLVGTQELVVRFTGGTRKGQEVRLVNYLTQVHNIPVKAGTRIIVCADTPNQSEPYYTVYNYNRKTPLVLILLIFGLCVLLIGRWKGLSALLGVAFSLLLIKQYTVPAIYCGQSPTAVVLLTILLAAGFSLALLNGLSKRTMAAFIATFLGIVTVGIMYRICSGLLRVNGFQMESSESLIVVSQNTGLSIAGLLPVCTFIAALGAVMDVSVSLTAALMEMYELNPGLTGRKMIEAGLNIGKDMIATMSNTLILAFVGSSLPTLLALVSYGYSVEQFLSSDFLAVELVQGICSTTGVVLTVPITACTVAVVRNGIRSSKEELNIKKSKR